MDENTAEHWNLKWARVLVKTRGWQHPSSLQVVVGTSCFALQLWWEEEPCISTVLPFHGSNAWNRKEDEVTHTRTKGGVGFLPPSSAPPQPEKLPSPVLGSGAPVSDKIEAAAPQSHAYDRDLGQCLDATAHLVLACPFGPGLGKA